ncbi:DUF7093 family protein [Haloplanus salilacus]|uniref:DUF7093 family protein n=1 Tax=Haloplanus salilacus TaxID=2949994 RepID=UPI0030D264B9
MGLRCLLGHEYANREVEREREERGDEVVVTYRTVEMCDRCGERRIVSENKEVRPVQGPADETMATGLGSDGVTPDLGEGDGPTDGQAVADDGTGDGGDPTVGESEELGSASEPEPDSEPEPVIAEADSDSDSDPDDGTGSVDDAIILDDDDGSSEDRGHGEWPAAHGSDSGPEPDPSTGDSTGPDATDGSTVVGSGDDWPEPEGEDEGFDAEPSDVDPPAATVGGSTTAEDERGGAATNGSVSSSTTDKQFVAADEVEPIGDDRDGTATEFFCPNCGYARAAGGSSMRAGDICPECHKSYITER